MLNPIFMAIGGPVRPIETPPCVRVRTRRLELVAPTPIDQRRKSKRLEVSIGKPNREGFCPSEVPRAASAATGVRGESRTDPQRQQSGAATACCFPLPPHRCPQSQSDPAGQVHQLNGRFAEAKIAAPTPQVRS